MNLILSKMKSVNLLKVCSVLVMVAGMTGLAVPCAAEHPGASRSRVRPVFNEGARVLFQGDSITDMNRGRSADPNHILGHGYAFIIASEQGAYFPERHLTFLNRGISGNRIRDLAGRWQTDTLDLKPDVLSILVGVNDVLLAFRANQTLDYDELEKTYDQLLAGTVAARPGIKLVLCAPFCLPGSNTKARWEEWQTAIKRLQGIVDKLGARYHAPVVHFQKIFDDACKRAPIEYWIWDGVHPTYSGHRLMADEWMRTLTAFYGRPKP